ncbi:MAG: MGMT family protein, partial [Oscillospiraceae bacterium]|nr:MGMT family protein [Oscillospiraceae bacterium]
HGNSDPHNIPCHRVVFKDGSLSKAFLFGGENRQRKLLEDEGVSFIGEKVDMKKHGFGRSLSLVATSCTATLSSLD